jgi:hypothetical protein
MQQRDAQCTQESPKICGAHFGHIGADVFGLLVVQIAAGQNALRGSGAGHPHSTMQVAHVGCRDRRITGSLSITAASNLHIAPDERR